MQFNFADIDGSFPRLATSQPGVLTGSGTLFVRRLIYGSDHRDLCLGDLTWEQIASAIFSLEGRHDVLIEGQEAYPYLVVGGGREGKYLVAAGQKHGVYFLSDPRSQEQEAFPVVLGGQLSEYAADLCVNGEMALNAAWSFVERGILLPSLRWVEDI